MKKRIIFVIVTLLFCLSYACGTTTGSQKKAAIYKPGKYVAKAIGFAGGLKVEVTVNKTDIVKVKIISHNETPEYLEVCEKPVIEQIIKKQSTQVDVVAGATMSSEGIMNAVNKALKEAKIK